MWRIVQAEVKIVILPYLPNILSEFSHSWGYQKFKTCGLVGKHLITPISFLSLLFYTKQMTSKFLSNHFLSSISMLPKISPRTPKSNQTDNPSELINEAIKGLGLGPEQDGTQTMWETEVQNLSGPTVWNWGNSIQPIKRAWLIIISSVIKVMIIDHVERTTSIIHSWLWIRHKKYTGCYPFEM